MKSSNSQTLNRGGYDYIPPVVQCGTSVQNVTLCASTGQASTPMLLNDGGAGDDFWAN